MSILDHKPNSDSEKERIEKSDGQVAQMVRTLPVCCAFFGERDYPYGAFRVWPGGFSVSRTLGDVLYKDPALGKVPNNKILIADPEITVTELTAEDEFLILASDGFWDVISSAEAVKLIRKRRKKKRFSPEGAGDFLCQRAFNYGSSDNITCIVVYFTHYQSSWKRSKCRELGTFDYSGLFTSLIRMLDAVTSVGT